MKFLLTNMDRLDRFAILMICLAHAKKASVKQRPSLCLYSNWEMKSICLGPEPRMTRSMQTHLPQNKGDNELQGACGILMCMKPCKKIKKTRYWKFRGSIHSNHHHICHAKWREQFMKKRCPQPLITPPIFPSKFQRWKLRQVKIVTFSGQKCVASRLAKLTGHYCVWGSSARRCFSSARCHVIILFLATNSSPTLVGEMCMCSEKRVFNRTRPTMSQNLCACEAGLRSNCESPRRLERPPHWEGEGSAGRMTFTCNTSSDLDPLCDWLIGIPRY